MSTELLQTQAKEARNGPSEARLALVEKAVRDWSRQLVDLTGKNQLLFYRTLKRGTLELTSDEPRALQALLSGKEVQLTDLVPRASEEFPDGLRRCQTVFKKSREHLEERGLATLYLAAGLATWSTDTTQSIPAAPVLLRPLEMRPTSASSSDFILRAVGEWGLNAVLSDYLRVAGLAPDFDQIEYDIDINLDAPKFEKTFLAVHDQSRELPDFLISPRIIVGNFAYAKLPMVQDLQNNIQRLAVSDIVAAIAGDGQSRDALARPPESDTRGLHPDYIPPSDEFLVLDADSSQNFAINRALSGQSLVIQGPPGTGKSQTIANLVAAGAARGKRVLFVAEKQAAIDAVVSRLRSVGLESIVMNLHGSTKSRKQVCDDLEASIQQASDTQVVDCTITWQKLERTRETLRAHAESLHRKHEPWGVSLFDVQEQILANSVPGGPVISISSSVAGRTKLLEMETFASQLEEWMLITEPFRTRQSPWSGVETGGDFAPLEVLDLVQVMQSQHLPPVARALKSVNSAFEDVFVGNLNAINELLQVLVEADRVAKTGSPALFVRDLAVDLEVLRDGSPTVFHHLFFAAFSRQYRETVRSVRSATPQAPRMLGPSLYKLVYNTQQVIERWRELGLPLPPRAIPGVAEALTALESIRRSTSRLQSVGLSFHTNDMSLEAVGTAASRLLEASSHVLQLSRIRELERQLERAGIQDLRSIEFGSDCQPEDAAKAFRKAWFTNVRDQLQQTDPALASFHGIALHTAAETFRHSDRQHIVTTPERIRRMCAEMLVSARNEFQSQDRFVRAQARRKRGHAPIRDLVRQAPDVLLAARPCWAMSPLQVSQLLPAEIQFDMAIFDEASQILPADAIPTIMRAAQMVVAGDTKQLAPTTFFLGQNEDEDDLDSETSSEDSIGETREDSYATGFESILHVAESILPENLHGRLRWHYRSKDERLIAFSNAHVYSRSLITFPGSGRPAPVSLTVVDTMGHQVNTRSSPPEVRHVVEMAIRHALESPDQSLGIIAMGDYHANRVESELIRRLGAESTQVREFFAEDARERAFVKNIERVQGDERDAIILSIGYGKNEQGDLPHRFGPLTQDKGERRLNVAVSRARSVMRVVSSFSPDDINLGKSKAEGTRLLKEFLQFAQSGGNDLGAASQSPRLNPFEIAVRDRLEKAGIRVIPQYGASSYRIDFAIPHPDDPSRMLLAVEADGASYHSSQSARDRDRLRQSVLESLGWRFVRIWSTDWFTDPEAQVDRVKIAVDAELKRSRSGAPLPQTEEMKTELLPTTATAAKQLVRPQRAGSRPSLRAGQSIQTHSHRALVRLAEWIQSDGILRTDEELFNEMMKELGYTKKGSRIVAELSRAIEAQNRQKRQPS